MKSYDFSWNTRSNNEMFLRNEIQNLNQKIENLLNLVYSSQPKQKEFLTIKEVAKMCKVKSLTTIWNWKQKGKLVPTHRAGNKPLYKRQNVLNFLAKKTFKNN